MLTNNSGTDPDEMKEKLQHIDHWLDEIVHVKNEPEKTPQKPFHKKSGRNNKKRHSFKQTKQQQPMKRVQNKRQKMYKNRGPRPQQSSNQKLRIIPLGGFEEVGKNMMLFEYGNDIIIIDMGFQFPTEDMLGIDYVIPDISYLNKKKKNIRGVFLTHGHLDHIGGIPYLLPKLDFPPVYGTKLTIGLVNKGIEEFKLKDKAKLITFDPKQSFKAGVFRVSFIRVNHSIPDAVSVVIETPVGRIVHTGDFKFDKAPHDQKPADIERIKAVGRQGVDLLISDSTNALIPGHTISEKVIAETLHQIIKDTPGRLIIASFSSLIGRLQQIMDSAVKCNRKIFISGRSMLTNVKIAQELGYIKVPQGVIIDIKKMKKYKDSQIIALTTGSQGEDFAALARIATDDHAHVKIKKGDTVVISSSPIIGNEPSIIKVINHLCRRGAKVITNKDLEVHTSGHAKQEELKMMLTMIRPKYFIPEHGDYYMRSRHAELAVECGVPENRIFLLDNGDMAVMTGHGAVRKAAEKVPSGHIMVEGHERSEVGADVLMDRQLMAENGVVLVQFKVNKRSLKLIGHPYVTSRGFVYANADSSNSVRDEVQKAARNVYKTFLKANPKKFDEKKFTEFASQQLNRLLVRMLDKRPLVFPMIVKI